MLGDSQRRTIVVRLKTEFSIVNNGVGGLALWLNYSQRRTIRFKIENGIFNCNSGEGGLALWLSYSQRREIKNFHLPTAVFRK